MYVCMYVYMYIYIYIYIYMLPRCPIARRASTPVDRGRKRLDRDRPLMKRCSKDVEANMFNVAGQLHNSKIYVDVRDIILKTGVKQQLS